MCINGAYLHLNSTAQNQRMRPSSKDPHNLQDGTEFGRHGLRGSAISSCGWSLTAVVGQLTGWNDVTFHIRQNALSVTTRMRPLTTSSSAESLPASSGMDSCSEWDLRLCHRSLRTILFLIVSGQRSLEL